MVMTVSGTAQDPPLLPTAQIRIPDLAWWVSDRGNETMVGDGLCKLQRRPHNCVLSRLLQGEKASGRPSPPLRRP